MKKLIFLKLKKIYLTNIDKQRVQNDLGKGSQKVQRDLEYIYAYCYASDYADGRMF